jgi:hypothetical protein
MALVFFSYSHADTEFRDQLERHLAMLKRQGQIEAWHDRLIRAGERIDDSISKNLEAADIILFLVSSDFLVSEYCYGVEVQKAVERHRAGSVKLVPVILRPCDWRSAPFGELLATPTDAKPVSKWTDRDEAWLDVVESIKRLLPPALERGRSPTGTAAKDTRSARPPDHPRSSNLRVRKDFSDADRSKFLRESFDFIARFFENSLGELSARNAGVEFEFVRVDANRFRSVIFKHGKTAAQCEIRLDVGPGVFGAGIAYSNQFSERGNSYNELLSVEVDEQAMFLQPAGFGLGGRSEGREHLSPEGAAELYWSELVDPLQR